MYLIVGLGNPGTEYEKTRHNMGFIAIEYILNEINKEEKTNYTLLNFKTKFSGKYLKLKYKEKDLVLLMPETYMNLSGRSIYECVNFFKIKEENIIVIYDDKDIKKSEIKIRKTGTSGGHNGINSILPYFKKFIRIRVGIGFKSGDIVKYVIGPVSNEEFKLLEEGCKSAAEAALSILKIGVDKTMNKFNLKEKTKLKLKLKKDNKNIEKKNIENKEKEEINKKNRVENINKDIDKK